MADDGAGRVRNPQRRAHMLRVREAEEQNRLEAEEIRRSRRVFQGGRGSVGGAPRQNHQDDLDAKIAMYMHNNPNKSFLEARDMVKNLPWEALFGVEEYDGDTSGRDVRSQRALTLALQRSAREREKREIRENRAAREKAAEEAVIAKKKDRARGKTEQNRARKRKEQLAQRKEAPKIRAHRLKHFGHKMADRTGEATEAVVSAARKKKVTSNRTLRDDEVYEQASLDFKLAIGTSKPRKIPASHDIETAAKLGPEDRSEVVPHNPPGSSRSKEQVYERASSDFRMAIGQAYAAKRLSVQHDKPRHSRSAWSEDAATRSSAENVSARPLGLAQRNSDLRNQVARLKQENEALKTEVLKFQTGAMGPAAGNNAASVGSTSHIESVSSETWGHLLAVSDDHDLLVDVLKFLYDDAVQVESDGGRTAGIEYALSVCVDRRRDAENIDEAADSLSEHSALNPDLDPGGDSYHPGLDPEPRRLSHEEMREQRLRALQGR